MQMYMSKPRLGVVTAAWANRPSASTAGVLFFATDVGSGVLFQANGTSFVPVGPGMLGASAVAASVSASTSEEALATVSIPAGVMGLGGAIEIRTIWTHTSSANTKTMRYRLGGISGTAFVANTVTTDATSSDERRIRNRGAANSQVLSFIANSVGGLGRSGSAVVTGTVDTSVAQDLVISGQKASAGETLTLESYEVWLLP